MGWVGGGRVIQLLLLRWWVGVCVGWGLGAGSCSCCCCCRVPMAEATVRVRGSWSESGGHGQRQGVMAGVVPGWLCLLVEEQSVASLVDRKTADRGTSYASPL